MDSNLVRRIGFAAVAIPLALLIVWLGGAALVALVTVTALLGLRELFGLARAGGVEPLAGYGYASALALPVLTFLGLTAVPGLRGWALLAAGLWVLGLLGWGLFARRPAERPLAAAAATALGVLYTAALPSFLIVLRHGPAGGAGAPRSWAGTWLVFFPLVVTWVVDTAAMFGGRSFGGPKLWPAVSPGKTRSGAAAGVIGGLAAAVLLDRLALAPAGVALGIPAALAAGLVLAVAGQIGDLVESNFKREAGVKDSSNLIPGHGGVLDRFDSLYFAVPVAAAAYRLAGVL
jgi:phosphatidate cytidylyltransferase